MSNYNAYYDSDEFMQRWYSRESIESIADDMGVDAGVVWRAARRRKLHNKIVARNMSATYQEQRKRDRAMSALVILQDDKDFRNKLFSEIISQLYGKRYASPEDLNNAGANLISDMLSHYKRNSKNGKQ